MDKHIAFVGAGAVGGFVGGNLARAGQNITLIDAWPEHVEMIKKSGIRLTTPEQSQQVIVRALHINEVQSLNRQLVDIAFIATKSYDTEWATMLIKPYLASNGFVVSLQNCINEERIARLVGWGRTVGCIVYTITVRVEGPGHVARTRKAGGAAKHVFSVGEIHGRITQRAEELAKIMSVVDGSTVTTNLWGERWAKLTHNSMHNGLAGITGLNHHGLAENVIVRRISIKLGGEAIRVGSALGFDIGPIRKKSPMTWLAASDGDKAALAEIEQVIQDEVPKMTDAARPSTAQDIQKGRRTEIEWINGYIVEKGRELGIATPMNQTIVEFVRQIELGTLASGDANVQKLATRFGV